MASDAGRRNYQQELNRMTPAAQHAGLGDIIYSLINQHNLLLSHLDTANVTGIGNANFATFNVVLPENRKTTTFT